MVKILDWFGGKLGLVEFIFSAVCFFFLILHEVGKLPHFVSPIVLILTGIPCIYFKVKIINKEDL